MCKKLVCWRLCLMLTVYFFVPVVGRSCVNELIMTVIVRMQSHATVFPLACLSLQSFIRPAILQWQLSCPTVCSMITPHSYLVIINIQTNKLFSPERKTPRPKLDWTPALRLEEMFIYDSLQPFSHAAHFPLLLSLPWDSWPTFVSVF